MSKKRGAAASVVVPRTSTCCSALEETRSSSVERARKHEKRSGLQILHKAWFTVFFGTSCMFGFVSYKLMQIRLLSTNFAASWASCTQLTGHHSLKKDRCYRYIHACLIFCYILHFKTQTGAASGAMLHYKAFWWKYRFIVIAVINQGQTFDELTWHAGDLRLFPLATGQAFNDGIQFLHEAVFTVVSHFGVSLVMQPLLPEHFGVGNVGGLATGGCWKPLWFLDPHFEVFKIRAQKKKELEVNSLLPFLQVYDRW